jgi:hypothetical protein
MTLVAALISSSQSVAQGVAKGTEPFKDESGETIRQLAAYENIPLKEAEQRLVLMAKASILSKRLAEAYPDKFSGMMAIQRPFLHFDVKMVGETGTTILEKVRLLTSDTDLLAVLGASPGVRSAKEMEKQARSMFAKLKAAGITGEIASSNYTGEIRILARDPENFISKRSRGLLSKDFNDLRVEKFDGIQPTVNIPGGRGWEVPNLDEEQCTTGFNVRQPSTNVYGVTTAGHCGNSVFLTVQSQHINVHYVGEWTSNDIDLQWGYALGAQHLIVPRFWNGTTEVNVTGALSEYAGMFACKYGQATSITCGYVDQFQYADAYGSFPRINRRVGFPIMTNFGDSGGPVYTGGSAVGTVHGKDIPGNLYFTTYRRWAPAGVNINIICAC